MQNISADVYIGQEFLPIMAELRKTCQVAMTDAVDPSKLLTMLKGRFGHILMLTDHNACAEKKGSIAHN